MKKFNYTKWLVEHKHEALGPRMKSPRPTGPSDINPMYNNPEGWRDYDPKQVMSFIYWTKQQLPPAEGTPEWEASWEKIQAFLNDKFPESISGMEDDEPEYTEGTDAISTARSLRPSGDEETKSLKEKATELGYLEEEGDYLPAEYGGRENSVGLSSLEIKTATTAIKDYIARYGREADGEVNQVAKQIGDILRWPDNKIEQLSDYLLSINNGDDYIIFGVEEAKSSEEKGEDGEGPDHGKLSKSGEFRIWDKDTDMMGNPRGSTHKDKNAWGFPKKK